MFTQPFIRAQIKETSKLRDTGLCAGNSPGTGEFHAQMDSDVENVSIWWRHHEFDFFETVWLCGHVKYNKMTGPGTLRNLHA